MMTVVMMDAQNASTIFHDHLVKNKETNLIQVSILFVQKKKIQTTLDQVLWRNKTLALWCG